MLRRIAKLVEEARERPTNRWGKGMWTHHITRVVDVAAGERLARMGGVRGLLKTKAVSR